MFFRILRLLSVVLSSFFFFTDTATTEIYTLSLHDALPISPVLRCAGGVAAGLGVGALGWRLEPRDRKSTRLNSSHITISYAVFCLKKKKEKKIKGRNEEKS